MLFNATYDTFEAIPEAYRTEFESVNGKWQLKQDAIPGAAELLNPGLEANRNRAMDQLKAAEQQRDAFQLRVTELEKNSITVQQPGSKVLSPEDAKMFDAYTQLGSVKDVKARIEKLPTLEKQLNDYKLSEQLKSVSEAGGLNHGVLTEWAQNPGENTTLSFFVKEETVDGKPVKTGYVKKEVKDSSGKVTETEHELIPLAKESLADWKFEALQKSSNGGGNSSQTTQTTQQSGGVRMPKVGSATEKTGQQTEVKRAVDVFNQERTQVPSPFQPVADAATTK